MAKYKRKSFSPHIYQDWIHLFRQCSQEQRAELLLAITDYPNYEPSADVPIWDFIKSQLEAQYQSMENKSQQMSTNRAKEKQKSTKVDQSQPLLTEVNKSTQIEIETRIETETKEKELSSDNSKKKVCEETVFNAGFQNWKFDPVLLKIAKKHWTADTIRKIEIDFSCQEYNTETSIQELLERYPSDKDKAVLPKNIGQYEYMRPQMQKWIDYKKSRGEKYKTEQSLMVCAKKLHELSGGNALNADAIIEQSIANNYAGLFPLKQNATPQMPRMSLKEMQEMQKRIEVQKILNGER